MPNVPSSVSSVTYSGSLRCTSSGRIGTPARRASSSSSRRGYMPGSWVRIPARNCAAIVGLEPRRAVRRHGERGRVRLAEPEARELGDVVPGLLGGGRIDPAADRPREEVGAEPRQHLVVVQMPAHVIGVGEVVAGERRERADHLFVEDDHPEGLLQAPGAARDARRSGARARRAGRCRAGSCRTSPGPDGTARCRRSGPRTARAGASAAARAVPATRSGSSRGCRRRGSARRSARRRARSDRDRPSRRWCGRSHRSRGASTRACAPRGCRASGSRAASTSSLSAWIMRWPPALRSSGTRCTRSWLASTMPHGCSAMCRGNPSSRSATRNSRSSWRIGRLQPLQLGQPFEPLAQVPRRDVGEGLGHDADLDLGQTERLADLPDRRARPVGVDHRDAGRPLVAVAGEDHVVDVLAPGRLHVDVDVGQLLAHRVHEPLERQVVSQRVDVGDAGEVAHERARGAAATAPRRYPSS